MNTDEADPALHQQASRRVARGDTSDGGHPEQAQRPHLHQCPRPRPLHGVLSSVKEEKEEEEETSVSLSPETGVQTRGRRDSSYSSMSRSRSSETTPENKSSSPPCVPLVVVTSSSSSSSSSSPNNHSSSQRKQAQPDPFIKPDDEPNSNGFDDAQQQDVQNLNEALHNHQLQPPGTSRSSSSSSYHEGALEPPFVVANLTIAEVERAKDVLEKTGGVAGVIDFLHNVLVKAQQCLGQRQGQGHTSEHNAPPQQLFVASTLHRQQPSDDERSHPSQLDLLARQRPLHLMRSASLYSASSTQSMIFSSSSSSSSSSRCTRRFSSVSSILSVNPFLRDDFAGNEHAYDPRFDDYLHHLLEGMPAEVLDAVALPLLANANDDGVGELPPVLGLEDLDPLQGGQDSGVFEIEEQRAIEIVAGDIDGSSQQ